MTARHGVMRIGIAIGVLAACGGGMGGGGDGGNEERACTQEARDIQGVAMTIESVGEFGDGGACPRGLVRNAAELAAAFGSEPVPASLAAVDFAVDRVVLGMTNPRIVFAVDNGAALVVGEQMLCQGIAPRCSAAIVRNTTRDALVMETCVYSGECNAP